MRLKIFLLYMRMNSLFLLMSFLVLLGVGNILEAFQAPAVEGSVIGPGPLATLPFAPYVGSPAYRVVSWSLIPLSIALFNLWIRNSKRVLLCTSITTMALFIALLLLVPLCDAETYVLVT